MTDQEREAQIRADPHVIEPEFSREEDCAFLLRLLDEARAEIARLTAPPSASAMEEAFNILNAAQNTIGDPVSDSPTSTLEMLRDDIARALEAAERRGAEHMREALQSPYCIEAIAKQTYTRDFWGPDAPKWPGMPDNQRAPWIIRAKEIVATIRALPLDPETH